MIACKGYHLTQARLSKTNSEKDVKVLQSAEARIDKALILNMLNLPLSTPFAKRDNENDDKIN